MFARRLTALAAALTLLAGLVAVALVGRVPARAGEYAEVSRGVGGASVVESKIQESAGAVTTSGIVTVDGRRPGPVFYGIGAISGGGGNSRLLIDYPPAARRRILDYLFKPGVGASLQSLKLEIGGDANSSDGSEPSVEPAPGQLGCGAGYEFWLARQALARNPSIKLYGLQWAAPAWASDGHGGIWSAADVRYVLDWMRCARRAGLHVAYLGGWNEHYTPGSADEAAWFEELRSALDANGFAGTRLVAADVNSSNVALNWRIADDLARNPAFNAAVGVIGVHDPCGHPSTGYLCRSTPIARGLSPAKPLLASELGMTPATGNDPALAGPGGLARSLNNLYLQAGITGTDLWPALDAMPPGLLFEDRGLITADWPWSGAYQVNPITWVVAQTTQFTAPGWRYVLGAGGFLPGAGASSYVTYEAPGGSAWTTVVQTSVARGPTPVSVQVTGGLPDSAVHVWQTSLRGQPEFARLPDIFPRHGRFTVTLAPGAVYTFTTRNSSSAGAAGAPGSAVAVPMPLPYRASVDGAGMPAMLAPMEGSFQYVRGVLTQTAVGQPVEWHRPGPGASPYAVVGSSTWSDYTVSGKVVLPGAGTGAMLIARWQGARLTRGGYVNGYELAVDRAGAWRVLRSGPHPRSLSAGEVRAAASYRLDLTTVGSSVSAWIDGRRVALVHDTAYRSGPAGLGSLGYYPVRYRDVQVRP